MAAIELRNLTKRYGSVTAVDAVTLELTAGTVTGLLGPNGAGKTTTLRMLLGLVTPTSGTATFDGRCYVDLDKPARTVGAVLEASSFHPGRRAIDHLRILASAAGLPAQRANAALEQVGMAEHARRRIGGFSLGMRQRLGLAAALLGEPDVLILDEPSNGLDPAGIREMREFIRRLGSSGEVTVFLSSHLLGEVQQVCDRVAIITRGRLVMAGTVAEVLAEGSTGNDVRVRVADLPGADAVLRAAGLEVDPGGDHFVVRGVDDPAQVTRLLADRGHYVRELTPIAADLETVFLQLTGEPVEQPAPVPAQWTGVAK